MVEESNFNPDKLYLRELNNTDLEITYKWVTDPLIREHSFNQSPITYEDHILWIRSKIQNPKCFYLIAELDDIKVGSIRFDMTEDEAFISYLLDSQFHGKGMGPVLLQKGIESFQTFIKENHLQILKMTGLVLKTNIPSVKSFIKLGFTVVEWNHNYKFEKILS